MPSVGFSKGKTEIPLVSTWWRGGLVVGRRTCDLGVAGSRPGRDAAAQASCSHPTASVTKQYNLVPAKAGK